MGNEHSKPTTNNVPYQRMNETSTKSSTHGCKSTSKTNIPYERLYDKSNDTKGSGDESKKK